MLEQTLRTAFNKTKVQALGEKEISSSLIGEQIMDGLQEIDEVAYVRFASVYRQFKDIKEFIQEIKDIAYNKKKI